MDSYPVLNDNSKNRVKYEYHQNSRTYGSFTVNSRSEEKC